MAAHSLTRSLYRDYPSKSGLYQIQRRSDNKTLDIGPVVQGGVADADAQNRFCADTSCMISIIYDQSGNGNDLTPAPGGSNTWYGDKMIDANAHRVSVLHANATSSDSSIHTTVYGAHFANSPETIESNQGYRRDKTTNIPKDDEAETIYAVIDGRPDQYSWHCCFDYGNAEIDNSDDGVATMEALYFGNHRSFGPAGGTAQGVYIGGGNPWTNHKLPTVQGDLENGIWAGDEVTHETEIVGVDFVFGMLKGGSGNHWGLKQGDLVNGNAPVTTYEGKRPKGYETMQKQGAIILGIGGDNSNRGKGTFYEGCIVKGYTSDSVDLEVFNEIKSVGYEHVNDAVA